MFFWCMVSIFLGLISLTFGSRHVRSIWALMISTRWEPNELDFTATQGLIYGSIQGAETDAFKDLFSSFPLGPCILRLSCTLVAVLDRPLKLLPARSVHLANTLVVVLERPYQH